MVQKRFKFPDGSVELYAEKVNNRGLCAIAQAESLRYKLLGGLAVRRCASDLQSSCSRVCAFKHKIESLAHAANCCRWSVSLAGLMSRAHATASCGIASAVRSTGGTDCTFHLSRVGKIAEAVWLLNRACYGVLRFIMESGAKGCEVIVSGKLRAQRAKAMKFKDGYMISSGQPVNDYIDAAVRHVMLRQGVLGIKVRRTGPQHHQLHPLPAHMLLR